MSRIMAIAVAAAALVIFSVPASAAEPANAKPQPSDSTGQQIFDSQPPETLMFSIDELTEIRNRMVQGGGADDRENSRNNPIEDASLYLSTILYYGPEEWTFWLNGVPIGPKQDLQSIEVTAITPSYVELLVPLSAQGMRPVRLSPNQSFITKSGVVVEGPTK